MKTLQQYIYIFLGDIGLALYNYLPVSFIHCILRIEQSTVRYIHTAFSTLSTEPTVFSSGYFQRRCNL